MLRSRMLAEWKPPSVSCASSFRMRYYSMVEGQLVPPSRPIVFNPDMASP